MERGVNLTNLSASEHSFSHYHFCRGNNNKRKSRVGLILAGSVTFMYLNQRLHAGQGDIIFIPEKIFCYSEWVGDPEIRVFYISFDMNSDASNGYELQKLPSDDSGRQLLRRTYALLQGGLPQQLEAYSLFYHFFAQCLPQMDSHRRKLDESLCVAIDYICSNWNQDFSVGSVAKASSVCESRLYHLFKEQLGQTPVSYLNAVKVNYAIQYLEGSDYSIGEICELTNFHSESYFRRTFRGVTGASPSDYRKRCRSI